MNEYKRWEDTQRFIFAQSERNDQQIKNKNLKGEERKNESERK